MRALHSLSPRRHGPKRTDRCNNFYINLHSFHSSVFQMPEFSVTGQNPKCCPSSALLNEMVISV